MKRLSRRTMYKSIRGVEKTVVEANREYEDKTARHEKLAAEIRKIYVENWAKTTARKDAKRRSKLRS